MSIETKLLIIQNRINLLKARGETLNANLINKLERKKRNLLAKQ